MYDFDFAQLKSETRQVVHETLGVSAFYKDSTMSRPREIVARWHNKIDRFGDMADQGYAEVVQGIDRVILFPAQTPTISFVPGGVVTFPKYCRSFRLDVQEPADGPDQVVWQAVHLP
jgi:hypothetical protein